MRAALLSLLFLPWRATLPVGASTLAGAVASGALASGLGYAVWYAVLPSLSRTEARVSRDCWKRWEIPDTELWIFFQDYALSLPANSPGRSKGSTS